MLRTHADNISEYLVNDPKGKLIPEFLITLADTMQENYKISCSEVANINEKIQHIRDIVMAQQSLSRVNGIFEKINLKDVMKATLMMIGGQLSEKNVTLLEDYQDVPEVYIDRSKLIQILVNLVQNAKDALLEDTTRKKDKHVKITIDQPESNKNIIRIIVKDNGIGILKENIDKIFSYGFSTKRNGHGIGLHSSALSAGELGGKLTMESDGIGQGASFILELPVNTQNSNLGDQHGGN